jgi:hypothetical protein
MWVDTTESSTASIALGIGLPVERFIAFIREDVFPMKLGYPITARNFLLDSGQLNYAGTRELATNGVASALFYRGFVFPFFSISIYFESPLTSASIQVFAGAFVDPVDTANPAVEVIDSGATVSVFDWGRLPLMMVRPVGDATTIENIYIEEAGFFTYGNTYNALTGALRVDSVPMTM